MPTVARTSRLHVRWTRPSTIHVWVYHLLALNGRDLSCEAPGTAPIYGAPALAALGPRDTAHDTVQFIVLRLDRDLPCSVDQSPLPFPLNGRRPLSWTVPCDRRLCRGSKLVLKEHEGPAAPTSNTAGGQPRLARCSWRTLALCEASSLAIVSRPA